MPQVLCPEQGTESLDKQTYILATDADMLFSDTAVLDLVNACNEDLRLGAACGRTYPMGKKINPIVWYQIFEYAKGEQPQLFGYFYFFIFMDI